MSPSKKATTPKLTTPLSRKATLVSVNISQWTARKLDRKVTDETNRRHGATADAGRYNKLLIAQEHLSELNGLVSKARTLHHKMTRPWADDGPRILANALYAKFTDEFRVLKRDFHEAADKFERLYPSLIAQRKASSKNGLFKDSDYPSPKDIRAKFDISLTVLPFPEVEDFRSDLDDDTVAEIKAQLTATSQSVVSHAMQATADQITEVVGHMAEKLKEYKTGKPGERKFFLDSLVTHVRDLAELLPAFNLTEDPKLDAITKRISKELCVEEAKTLRENDDLRADVAKSADEIVAAVSGLFG